jgi:hypothetical protein
MVMLILGFLLGLAAGPFIRSWVVWREHRAASREAWLAEETLKRLEAEHRAPRQGAGDRSAS